MHCPTCPGSLIPEKMTSVEVDRCGACGGVWFDMGELERVHPARAAKGKLKLSMEQGAAKLVCPRCEMATLQAVAAEGIPARWCEFCRGLFVSKESMTAVEATRSLSAGGVGGAVGTAVGDEVAEGVAEGVAVGVAEGVAVGAAGGAVEVGGTVLGWLLDAIDLP